MKFEPVALNDQHVVENTAEIEPAVKHYCARLLESLKKAFDSKPNQLKYGVEFFSNERLEAEISTPFGKARGRLVLQISGSEINGRYVFEKGVVSEHGLDSWRPVWALVITKDGMVRLGDEGSMEINAAGNDTHGQAITAVARSLLYAIGVSPTFL